MRDASAEVVAAVAAAVVVLPDWKMLETCAFAKYGVLDGSLGGDHLEV